LLQYRFFNLRDQNVRGEKKMDFVLTLLRIMGREGKLLTPNVGSLFILTGGNIELRISFLVFDHFASSHNRIATIPHDHSFPSQLVAESTINRN
jgi:hypothetical protein